MKTARGMFHTCLISGWHEAPRQPFGLGHCELKEAAKAWQSVAMPTGGAQTGSSTCGNDNVCTLWDSLRNSSHEIYSFRLGIIMPLTDSSCSKRNLSTLVQVQMWYLMFGAFLFGSWFDYLWWLLGWVTRDGESSANSRLFMNWPSMYLRPRRGHSMCTHVAQSRNHDQFTCIVVNDFCGLHIEIFFKTVSVSMTICMGEWVHYSFINSCGVLFTHPSLCSTVYSCPHCRVPTGKRTGWKQTRSSR